MAKKPNPDELKSVWAGRLKRMKDYQKRNSTTWDRNEKLLFGKTDSTDAGKENL